MTVRTLHDGEHDEHIGHPHYGSACMVEGNDWRSAEERPPSRALEVVETFEITGRGTAYIVTAGDPAYMAGDNVLLDGAEMVVTAVEMRPTAIPQYVVNGKQTILLRPAEGAS